MGGVIYVIEQDGGGSTNASGSHVQLFKVGHSQSLEGALRRVTDLQTGNPDKLTLVAFELSCANLVRILGPTKLTVL